MRLISPPEVNQKLVTTKIRGYPLTIRYQPNTEIGRYLYYRGIYEEPIIHKMASITKPGMCFLDVGANIGVYSLVAAHNVGPSGRVLAVEPQSTVFRLLRDNVKMNNLTNVELFNCALGKTEEQAEIYLLDEANDGASRMARLDSENVISSEEINVIPMEKILEDAGIDKIDVMKIDVEGAEMLVLEGAKSVFNRKKPQYIFVECIDKHLKMFGSSSYELLSFMKSYGYKTFKYHKWWHPITPQHNVSSDIFART